MFLPFKEIPFTYSMIALMSTVTLVGWAFKNFYNRLRFYPFKFLIRADSHTIITSAFVHINLLHLLTNLYLFYIMSYDLEYVLFEHYNQWYSRIFLFSFFCATTILTNLLSGWQHRKNLKWSTVGASGYIFALATFCLLYKPLDHSTTKASIIPLYYGYQFCLALLAGSYLYTFRKSDTNQYAHFYGAVLGILMAVIVRPQLVSELVNHFSGH